MKLNVEKELKKLGYTDKELTGKFGLIADVMKICRKYLEVPTNIR